MSSHLTSLQANSVFARDVPSKAHIEYQHAQADGMDVEQANKQDAHILSAGLHTSLLHLQKTHPMQYATAQKNEDWHSKQSAAGTPACCVDKVLG